MTNKEAIQELRWIKEGTILSQEARNAIDIAITALQSKYICEEIAFMCNLSGGAPGGARKLMEDAPEVKPEPKWIPVSERLPEDKQLVLVTYKTTDSIHVCRYHEDGSRNQWYSFNDMCREHNNAVLAWMPLPEPYREEGDQDG